MDEPIGGHKTEIKFEGKTITIRTIRGELLGNGWIDFGVKSDDNTLLEVFGMNPATIAVKPKHAFDPDFDVFQRTPRQTELAKEIWTAIQRLYF